MTTYPRPNRNPPPSQRSQRDLQGPTRTCGSVTGSPTPNTNPPSSQRRIQGTGTSRHYDNVLKIRQELAAIRTIAGGYPRSNKNLPPSHAAAVSSATSDYPGLHYADIPQLVDLIVSALRHASTPIPFLCGLCNRSIAPASHRNCTRTCSSSPVSFGRCDIEAAVRYLYFMN